MEKEFQGLAQRAADLSAKVNKLPDGLIATQERAQIFDALGMTSLAFRTRLMQLCSDPFQQSKADIALRILEQIDGIVLQTKFDVLAFLAGCLEMCQLWVTVVMKKELTLETVADIFPDIPETTVRFLFALIKQPNVMLDNKELFRFVDPVHYESSNRRRTVLQFHYKLLTKHYGSTLALYGSIEKIEGGGYKWVPHS